MTKVAFGHIAGIEKLGKFIDEFESLNALPTERSTLHDLRVALFKRNGSIPKYVYGQIEVVKGKLPIVVISPDTVDILNMIYCRKKGGRELINHKWANNSRNYSVALWPHTDRLADSNASIDNESLVVAQLKVHESATSRILVTQKLVETMAEIGPGADNKGRLLVTGNTVLLIYQGANSNINPDKLA